MAGVAFVDFDQPIAMRAAKIHQRHYDPTGVKKSDQ
jgi:hypothetical protein